LFLLFVSSFCFFFLVSSFCSLDGEPVVAKCLVR
jgi:hypothetical protein